MTIDHTPIQGLPYPDVDEYINAINKHIHSLATAVETQLVMKFADMTTLGNVVTAPTAGMLAYITADKTLLLYDGTAWQRVYPFSPHMYSGNTAPSSTLGQPGDFYVQW